MKYFFTFLFILILLPAIHVKSQVHPNDDLLYKAIIELEVEDYYISPLDNCINLCAETLACHTDPQSHWLSYQVRHCSEIISTSPGLDKIKLPPFYAITSYMVEAKSEKKDNNPSFQISQWQYCESEEADQVIELLDALSYNERKCLHNGPWRWWKMENIVFVIFSPNTSFPSEFQNIAFLLQESMQ